MAGGAGSIGELLAALRRMGERLDMKVSVDVSKYPEVKFRSPFESGNGTMRIKIEVKVNTYERSPAQLLPTFAKPHYLSDQNFAHRIYAVASIYIRSCSRGALAFDFLGRQRSKTACLP